tara:strand:- start:3371 stop:3727 length:357 start_codon:yes stop_codon:yes gene_type:complete
MYYNIKIDGKIVELALSPAMLYASLKEICPDEYTANMVYNNRDNIYSFHNNGKVVYIQRTEITIYALFEESLPNTIATFRDKHSATMAKLEYEHLDYESGLKPNYQIQKIQLICPNER